MQILTRLACVTLFALSGIYAAAHPGPLACGSREGIIQRLKSDYGERQIAAGLQSPTRAIEIWASDGCVDTTEGTSCQTFTILWTTVGGMSCILVSGDFFQYHPDELSDADRPNERRGSHR